MTTILSREWETQDCADIAKHLKWLIEHVETLDQQLVTTRDINAKLAETCKDAIGSLESINCADSCSQGIVNMLISRLKSDIAQVEGVQ